MYSGAPQSRLKWPEHRGDALQLILSQHVGVAGHVIAHPHVGVDGLLLPARLELLLHVCGHCDKWGVNMTERLTGNGWGIGVNDPSLNI